MSINQTEIRDMPIGPRAWRSSRTLRRWVHAIVAAVTFIGAFATLGATPKNPLFIQVVDTAGAVVKNADVTLVQMPSGRVASLSFDSSRGGYISSVDVTFPALVVVRTEALPTAVREIVAGHHHTLKCVIGSAPDGLAPVDGEWRPYSRYPGVLGVVPSRSGIAGDGVGFLKLLRSLGLTVLLGEWDLLPAIRGGAPIPVLIPAGHAAGELLKRLRSDSLVSFAGPILRWNGGQITIFTQQLWVRPVPEVPADDVRALLEREGFRVENYHTFFRAFSATADISTGEEIINLAERLLRTGKIASADLVPYMVPEFDGRSGSLSRPIDSGSTPVLNSVKRMHPRVERGAQSDG